MKYVPDVCQSQAMMLADEQTQSAAQQTSSLLHDHGAMQIQHQWSNVGTVDYCYCRHQFCSKVPAPQLLPFDEISTLPVTDITMTSDSSQYTETSGPKTCCKAQHLESQNMHVSHRTIFSSQFHLILWAQLPYLLSIHIVGLAATGDVHNTASCFSICPSPRNVIVTYESLAALHLKQNSSPFLLFTFFKHILRQKKVTQ